MGVYVDGVPLESIVALGKKASDRWSRGAEKSDFKDDTIVFLEVSKDKGKVRADYWYTDSNFELHQAELELNSMTDLLKPLQEKKHFERLNVHFSDKDNGVEMFVNPDFRLHNNVFDCMEVASFNRVLSDKDFDKFETVLKDNKTNFVEQVKLCENCSALSPFLKNKEDEYMERFESTEMGFVYNERNWRTDFCVVMRNHPHIEFDGGYKDKKVHLDIEDIKDDFVKECREDFNKGDVSCSIDDCSCSPFVFGTDVRRLASFVSHVQEVVSSNAPGRFSVLDNLTYDSFVEFSKQCGLLKENDVEHYDERPKKAAKLRPDKKPKSNTNNGYADGM